jgi:hypothetical protein
MADPYFFFGCLLRHFHEQPITVTGENGVEKAETSPPPVRFLLLAPRGSVQAVILTTSAMNALACYFVRVTLQLRSVCELRQPNL